jgi:hypothetical protein
MRKPSVSNLELSVTKITAISKGYPIASSTGFLYVYNATIFLVTNRHCFIDETRGFYPNKVQILLHNNQSNMAENKLIELELYNGEAPLWLEHKHKGIDIAVLPLKIPQGEEYKGLIIMPFSRENFLPDDVRLDIGDALIAIGYPLGFHDDIHNLPIARNATIASPYSVFFGNLQVFKDKGERPFFLVDAKLHEGTSGAPVITKINGITKTASGMKIGGGSGYFLIGINSGQFKDLDLSIVWYIELVEEIINGTSSLK